MAEEQEVVRKSRAPGALELAAGPVVAAARTQEVEPTQLLELVAELEALATAEVLGKEQVRDLDLAEAETAAVVPEQAVVRKLLALEAARVEAARIPEAEPTQLLELAAELAVPAMAVDLVKAQGRG